MCSPPLIPPPSENGGRGGGERQGKIGNTAIVIVRLIGVKLVPSIVTCAASPLKSPMKSPVRSGASPTLDEVLNSLLGLSASDVTGAGSGSSGSINGFPGGCTLRRPTSQPSIHLQRCAAKENVPEARSFNDLRSASNAR